MSDMQQMAEAVFNGKLKELPEMVREALDAGQ